MSKKNLMVMLSFVSLGIVFMSNINVNASDGVEKILSARGIEREGEKLYKQGLYDEALNKFKQADQPVYRLYADGLNDYARSYMRMIYLIQGEYDLGLNIASDALKKFPEAPANSDAKQMFEALIATKVIGTGDSVYRFIEKYRAAHADDLPPRNYIFTSSAIVSIILRLYDTIGDYEAGIAFIDEILAFFRTGKAGDPTPGRVDAEYLKVREAFEQSIQDRKNGVPKPKGKPDRATQALIQSDYFPW